MVILFSIINANELTVAFYCELHIVICIRYDISVFVSNVNSNIGKVCTVRRDFFTVCGSIQFCFFSCRFNRSASFNCAQINFVTFCIPRFCRDLTIFIRHIPCQIQVFMLCTFSILPLVYLIGISGVRFHCFKRLGSQIFDLSIRGRQSKLDFCRVGVNHHRNLSVFVFLYHICIPCRKDM